MNNSISTPTTQYDEEEKVKKFRKLVNDAVIQAFTSIDCKSMHGEEPLIIVVKFIKHCMEISPQVFVETKTTSPDHISIIFSKWLLQQICVILSRTNAKDLHEAYVKLTISLFELIQSKNIFFFNLVLTDFFRLMWRLGIFYGQYRTGCRELDNIVAISTNLSSEKLNTFDLDLSKTELKFESAKELEVFVCNLVRILDFVVQHALLSPSDVLFSWKIIFNIIAYGDLASKSSSIACMVTLHRNYGFNNELFVMRKMNNLIFALLKMLISSFSDEGEDETFHNLISNIKLGIQEIYSIVPHSESLFSECDLHNLMIDVMLLLREPLVITSSFQKILHSLCHIVIYIVAHWEIYDRDKFKFLIYDFFKFMIENSIAISDDDAVVESLVKSAHFLEKLREVQEPKWQYGNHLSVQEILTNAFGSLLQKDKTESSHFDQWQRQISTILKILVSLQVRFGEDKPNFEKNGIHLLLTPTNLQIITNKWFVNLQEITFFGKIIECIYLFLFLKHLKYLSIEFLNEFKCLLTSPWGIIENPSIQMYKISPEALKYETKKLIVQSVVLLKDQPLQIRVIESFLKGDHEMRVLVFEMLPILNHFDVCNENNLYAWISTLRNESKGCIVDVIFPCALAKQTLPTLHDSMHDTVLKCHACDFNSVEVKYAKSQDLLLLLDLIKDATVVARRKSVSCLSRVMVHSHDKGRVLNVICNYLTEDDYEVRRLFCDQLSKIVLKIENSSLLEDLSSILKSKYVEACSDRNIKIQGTLIQAISIVAQQLPMKQVNELVILLLQSIVLSNVPTIKAIARLEIKKVWSRHRATAKAFFHELKEPICKFMLLAINEVSQNSVCHPENVVTEIAMIFEFSSLKSCMQSCLRYLLPIVVSQISSTSSNFLKWLTHVLKKRHREVFMENLNFIFCYLICHCTHEQCEAALMYIQEKSGLQIESLLRAEFQRVLNELILNFSSHYDQVFSGLILLASRSECKDVPINITNNLQMAQFLQPRLLGFLTCFDSQLLPSNVHIDRKRKALKSLKALIQLMGARYITPVRMKVMATLRIAIRFDNDDFPELCCQAWDMFVRNLELPALGPMLNQIIATLLPLTNLQPAYVASIFKFLIIENQSVLKEYFCDIYFTPDFPEFEEIKKTLAEHNETQLTDLKSQITHAIKGITHESSLVRLHALKKMKTMLQQNQAELYKCVLGTDNVDHVISQLVSTLMKGCRDPDCDVRTMIGECIGELGAIDPGRLEIHSTNQREEMSKIHCSVNEDNFAFDLISELVRAFLSAEDTRTQNCSAFAIQEVLQIFNCDGTNSPTQGGRLWGRFPQHVLEIITPLLHSKYKNSSERPQPSFSRPIFLSSHGQSFKEWIIHWAVDLVSKIKHPLAKKIFDSCKMIMLHDLNVALYLLPRILIYVLLDGSTEVASEVRNELLEVLNSCSNLQPRPNNVSDHSDINHLSAQVIFSCFDYITKWIRKKHTIVTFQPAKRSVKGKGSTESDKDTSLNSIKAFIDSIPKDLLAKSSFYCQGYSRSLMHLEEYLRDKSTNELQNKLNFLQEIFIALDEPDGVAGVAASRSAELSIQDQIALHESNGRYHDALACYEHAVVVDSKNVGLHHGLLRCLMKLDQPSIALTYSLGLTAQQTTWNDQMNKYQVEAAWKLGQWDDLSTYLNVSDRNDRDWMINVGKILLASKNGDQETVLENLQVAKNDLMIPLSAASMENGAYQRGYQHILRLHMLTEIDFSSKLILKGNKADVDVTFESLFRTWLSRADAVQSSLRYVEPLLKLRRAILGLLLNEQQDEKSDTIRLEIGKCWLKSAKLARINGHFQSAYSFLLDASNYNLCEVYYEKAEWFWSKGDAEQAILTLQRGVDMFYPDLSDIKSSSSQEAKNKRYECAKMKLLLTRYSEESASLNSESIVKMYRKVVELAPEWEDAQFYIGQAYDRIMQTVDAKEEQWNYLICIVKHFASSLQFGSRHVYQSLPKLFSIWLDFGSEVADLQSQIELSKSSDLSKTKYLKKMKIVLSSMTSIITSLFTTRIPSYIVFTAFPQLISQVCHPNSDVFEQLKKLIAHLLITYPNQAMWMIMAVSKSKFSIRADRCKEIFNHARSLKPDLHKFIQDASKFTDCLIDLSNKEPSKDSEPPLSMNQHFKSIIRLVSDENFSSIMLPLQASMTVTLPSMSGPHPNHNPFIQTAVFVSGFDNKIEILSSLQKPKKIALRGNDGKFYDFMCKAKDDLRIDCRLMEFNSLVNKYLYHDPESRRRHLHIRTYCVTPINEECGLIEWVPNLEGLRQILVKIYKERGLYKSSTWIMSKMCPKKAPIEAKVKVFREVFMKEFPPVFSEWFLKTFPDPTAWYMARLSNARTTAVMSMVGYILGLGDRHGDNINYDASCGDAIHVDFNCLFNKGETFDIPEKVPFRLTRNMIESMGPLGVEGIFRKACEVTLRVMRMQKGTLMSVLKPFIHDPLVEWGKLSKSRSRSTTAEVMNKKAKTDVQNCEQRLRGIVNMKVHGIPLSIEGQVDYLIKEATDDKNLALMYIGWGAYL